MLRRIALPTTISTIAALALTGAATLSIRYSLVSAGCSQAVVATETSLRLRWSVAAVLATVVTIPALLVLASLVKGLSSPWRASLGFVLYLFSPLIALLIAFACHALVAPPTLPDGLDLPAAPGPLFVFLPVALGFGALVLVGFRPSPSQRPA